MITDYCEYYNKKLSSLEGHELEECRQCELDCYSCEYMKAFVDDDEDVYGDKDYE